MMKVLQVVLLAIAMLAGQTLAQSETPRYVVFVHAGPKLNDPKIKQVAGALFEKGYLVRAPDNERDMVGGAGVDYFDPSAKQAAADIADLVNTKLKQLGLLGEFLQPRFQRVKNPPNYIGVWLFGPKTSP